MMKTAFPLSLILVLFLSSDLVIQGTQGLKCMVGGKCSGNGSPGCVNVELRSMDCPPNTRKCEKRTFDMNGNSGSMYNCGIEAVPCEDLTAGNAKTTCRACQTDDCNADSKPAQGNAAAPKSAKANANAKSAQGLGLLMIMTVALSSVVVILGM